MKESTGTGRMFKMLLTLLLVFLAERWSMHIIRPLLPKPQEVWRQLTQQGGIPAAPPAQRQLLRTLAAAAGQRGWTPASTQAVQVVGTPILLVTSVYKQIIIFLTSILYYTKT